MLQVVKNSLKMVEALIRTSARVDIGVKSSSWSWTITELSITTSTAAAVVALKVSK